MSACSPSGGALSQLSDSGQTLSEDSGVDIAESGHVSKDSSPHSSRTRLPRDTQGGGGDNPSKPVRGVSELAVMDEWMNSLTVGNERSVQCWMSVFVGTN